MAEDRKEGYAAPEMTAEDPAQALARYTAELGKVHDICASFGNVWSGDAADFFLSEEREMYAGAQEECAELSHFMEFQGIKKEEPDTPRSLPDVLV